jgi:hypothetical protein
MWNWRFWKRSKYSRNQQKARYHQYSSDRDKNIVAGIIDIRTAIDRVANAQHARHNQTDRHERAKAKRDWITITALIIAAGVAAWGILRGHWDTERALADARETARQQHVDTLAALAKTEQTIAALNDQGAALKKSAEASERSADLSESAQRAWVAPLNYHFVNLADPDDPLKIGLSFQNVGREPARNTKMRTITGIIPLASIIPPIQWHDLSSWYNSREVNPKTLCSHFVETKQSVVVYPSTLNVITQTTSKWKIDQGIADRLGIDKDIPLPIEDIKSGRFIYFVGGCATYASLGKTRFSSFCAYVTPIPDRDISQWTFSACPVGNDDWTQSDNDGR